LGKNKTRLKAWFEFPFDSAITFWGSPSLALLMEAPGRSPIQKQFRLISTRQQNKMSTADARWGIPDVRSARKIAGLTAQDFRNIFAMSVANHETLERGWRCPSIQQALDICECLGWPLGLLFRTVDGEFHRMVALSRLYGPREIWDWR
jgi:hypothetical protein